MRVTTSVSDCDDNEGLTVYTVDQGVGKPIEWISSYFRIDLFADQRICLYELYDFIESCKKIRSGTGLSPF